MPHTKFEEGRVRFREKVRRKNQCQLFSVVFQEIDSLKCDFAFLQKVPSAIFSLLKIT